MRNYSIINLTVLGGEVAVPVLEIRFMRDLIPLLRAHFVKSAEARSV